MIMYNTQNHWVYGVCPLSRILNNSFRKVDVFPCLGEGKETPTLLGPLERANLNQSSLKFIHADRYLLAEPYKKCLVCLLKIRLVFF
jgi:hypothetical protein